MRRTRIYCISGGAASAAAFLVWFKSLPDDLTLELLELPGRGIRRSDPSCWTLSETVEDLYGMVREKQGDSDEPYYLVGYCFGALCAYALCHRMIQNGYPPPNHLFVCGSLAPDRRQDLSIFTDKVKRKGIEEVTLGYFPETVFRDRRETERIARRFVRLVAQKCTVYNRIVPLAFEELFPGTENEGPAKNKDKAEALRYANETQETFYRDLQSSWTIDEMFEDADFPVLPVDITAFAGTTDTLAPHDEAARWEAFTSRSFSLVDISGGHGFVIDEQLSRECVKVVSRTIHGKDTRGAPRIVDAVDEDNVHERQKMADVADAAYIRTVAGECGTCADLEPQMGWATT